MKIAILIALAALTCVGVEGLYCHTCINALSNRDCRKYGEYKRCMKNENACHNSVRKGPFGTMITKRCKQVVACDNNYIQNPRWAWTPSQCNRGTISSVCRCCCTFDGCNGPTLFCLKKSNCRAMSTPRNGSQKCTKQNLSIGTVCRFQCDQGYAMEGKRRSKCIRSQGSDPKFNRSPPICKPRACPDIPNAPQDGSVDCTDGNQIGSLCTFDCNAPHDILGEKEITCRGNGEWSSLPPTCAVAECNTLTPPVNGNMICTLDNQEDSECTFSCLDGYQLVGAPSAVCIVVNGAGVWSENVPVCEPKVCDPVIDPENGNSVCDDRTNVDSSCRFACDDAYNLVGSAVTTCVIVNGNPRWDLPTPVCEPKVCDPVIDPENGNSVCDDGTNVDSSCSFACDDTYSLVGSAVTTCVIVNGNPRWDLPTPVCEPPQCEMEAPFYNGNVTCTNDNVVGSVCTYTCNDNRHYTLNPPEVTTNQCLNNKTWNVPRPCCYAMCSVDETNFDGLIILDSSSSVGTENFDMMKEFVKQIVSLFNIGQNASRVGIFRYNRRVDSRSQIHLSQYLDDKPGLLDAIDRIPYNGAGTFTGRALTFARDEFREEFNGNREDVHDIIILITDGRAADNVATISSQLRLQGVTVVVIGVEPPRGQLDRDQLLTIATTPGDLVIAEGGFRELNTALIFDKVQTRFCVEGCLVL